MKPTLPSAPADALRINASALRPVIRTVVKLAETFGFWDRPRAGSATATEEMSALDTLYWIYKSRNPVEHYEKSIDAALLLDRDLRRVMPPEGLVEESSVTLGAGGDMLRSPGIDASEGLLFERVADLLFAPDIAYGTWESPVTTQPLVEEVIGDAGPPLECASRAHFDIFKGHEGRKFDILNTATNHAFDMGVEGVETTLDALESEGIVPLGTQRTPEEYGQAKIIERNGIRIGFVTDCFGLNGRDLPEADRFRINVSKLLSKHQPPDLALLKRQIDDCRARDCDFVLASIHWGHEFELFPRKVQLETAREVVEYGADSIICHDPHVIQPVEVYRPKRDPKRQAIIAHSLGSLTWSFVAPHIVLSLILNLRLVKGTLDGQSVTHLAEAKATPVFRTLGMEDGRQVTRIEKLADHDRAGTSALPQAYLDRIRYYADLVLGPAA